MLCVGPPERRRGAWWALLWLIQMGGMHEATCTLAIVTLNSFGAFALPGRLRHGVQSVDKATYREVYQAARALEEQCVAPGGRPANVGWTVVGESVLLSQSTGGNLMNLARE